MAVVVQLTGMKSNELFQYNEPIFLIAGEESTFLDGALISEFGIILDQNSSIPPKNGTIEFSFSGTDRVVRANYNLKLWQDYLFIEFKDLSKNDLSFIRDIHKKTQSKSGPALSP